MASDLFCGNISVYINTNNIHLRQLNVHCVYALYARKNDKCTFMCPK